MQFLISESQATICIFERKYQLHHKDDNHNRSQRLLSVSGGIVVNGQYIALGPQLPGATQHPTVFTAAATPVKHYADSFQETTYR